MNVALQLGAVSRSWSNRFQICDRPFNRESPGYWNLGGNFFHAFRRFLLTLPFELRQVVWGRRGGHQI